MKNTVRITVLCFLAGSISGLLTVVLACRIGYIFWSAISITSFITAVFFALAFAYWCRWIVIQVTRKQVLIAATIMTASYPVSLIAMLLTAVKRLYLTANMRGSLAFDLFSYSTLFRAPVSGIFEERSVMISGLTLAAILGALCLVVSLRVVTQRWDKRVVILMLIGLVLTPVLDYLVSFGLHQGFGPLISELLNRQAIALDSAKTFIYPEPVLFCYNDAVVRMFVLGDAFFAALAGYWLKRAFTN